MIAKNLAYGTYSRVYVVDDEDNGVKDFIRMRDDTKDRCKSIKQQLQALCLRTANGTAREEHGRSDTENG